VPERLKKVGDPAADIDDNAGSLAQLLELAERDEAEGLGDAPWPPHFRKQQGEPKRVQPSRDRDRKPQPGRVGDPQPPGRGGRQPEPQRRGRKEFDPSGRRKRGERTGQGYDHEFEDEEKKEP
jgi:bifunctional non-homologous end joining protein LigD